MTKYKNMPLNELKKAIEAAVSIANNAKVSKRTREIAKRKSAQMQVHLDEIESKKTEITINLEQNKHLDGTKKNGQSTKNPIACNDVDDNKETIIPELAANTNEDVSINEIKRVFATYFRDILKSRWLTDAESEAKIIAAQSVEKDEFGRISQIYDADDFLADIIRSKLFKSDGTYQAGRVQFAKCVGLFCKYCLMTKVNPELVTRAILYTKRGKISGSETILFSLIREIGIKELKK